MALCLAIPMLLKACNNDKDEYSSGPPPMPRQHEYQPRDPQNPLQNHVALKTTSSSKGPLLNADAPRSSLPPSYQSATTRQQDLDQGHARSPVLLQSSSVPCQSGPSQGLDDCPRGHHTVDHGVAGRGVRRYDGFGPGYYGRRRVGPISSALIAAATSSGR